MGIFSHGNNVRSLLENIRFALALRIRDRMPIQGRSNLGHFVCQGNFGSGLGIALCMYQYVPIAR